MLRFALNSLESVVGRSVYIYIYYLIGHAKLLLWFLRHFFEERLRRDKIIFGAEKHMFGIPASSLFIRFF